jgi:DNA repair exonuclease SbcCD ATPase subunit
MKTGLLGVTRIANLEMQELMDEVSQKGLKILESRGALGRLKRLVLRLRQVDRHLAEGRGSGAKLAEAESEVLRYEENLKALKAALETLQRSLLAQKSHLENIRANLGAASSWAASLRQTS